MAAIASNLIGKGEYGEVKITQVAGVKFALKTTELPIYPNELETVMACVREEAMTLRHKHIIERIWCRFWNGAFQLCMELGQPVGQAPGQQVLEEIGQALYFMHSKGFRHRDVKPSNIVRVGNTLKLIDFGLTRKGDASSEMSSYMITRWYRPPEMLRICEDFDKMHYDGRCDMWSLALTAYHIQNGKPLFYGNAQQILSQYAKWKESAKGLFSHLLCEYEDRYTAKQMLESHNIPLIEGTVQEVRPRNGIVAEYVQAMLKGDDKIVSSIGYEGINKEL
tara:strand:- start:2661 stop:3497 length:837 start_codon:yes stop_codon:yes gene_type:complete